MGAGTMVAATLAAVLTFPATGSAAVTSVRTWSAGTMTPGQSKSYTWNNANSDLYQANAVGVRTSNSNAPCYLEVAKQWYRRAAGGARQFLVTIKNVDSVNCDARVYLALIDADQSGSTGVINPGRSKTWFWHNSDVWNLVHLAGVTPNNPGSGTCQFEVTWKNRVTPSGEQQFTWTVSNTGSTACDGQWRLAWLPVDQPTIFDDAPSPPGGTGSLSSLVDAPFRVYAFGLVPAATGAGNCDWGPRFREMGGDPSIPTPGARTAVGYLNVGSVACVLTAVTKAYIS